MHKAYSELLRRYTTYFENRSHAKCSLLLIVERQVWCITLRAHLCRVRTSEDIQAKEVENLKREHEAETAKMREEHGLAKQELRSKLQQVHQEEIEALKIQGRGMLQER